MSRAKKQLDVVGIGSMAVDRIHRVARIIGADEKSVLQPYEDGFPVQSFVGGVVLNHLGWAAALGLKAGIFGKQADDPEGRWLRAAMDRLGIEHQIVLDGSASSLAQIFVDAEGGRAIYMAPGATSETTPDHVREHHADFIRRARRFTTEISQLPLDATRAALEIAREAGVPTVVDLDVPPSQAVPGLGSEEDLRAVLELADLIKPSKSAARELVPEAGEDALALATGMRDCFGSAAVVVTDGENGCAIDADDVRIRIDAYSVVPTDTTGAGDAFLGGLLVGLDQGLSWEAAARLGNACGAACTEKLGAFPDDPERARRRVLALYDGPSLELRPLPSGVARGGPDAAEALATMEVAVDELSALRERIDPNRFDEAVALIRSVEEKGGRVHVTGIGKPEHVANYGASLMASTGTPATFLHGTEVIHGSAGQVVNGDVVIAISNSGETPELRAAVKTVQAIGARIIGITGSPRSWLARESDVVIDAGVRREGGGLDLAPRASVVAQLVVIASLAASLERARGFTEADYCARHPAGELGKRLRRLPQRNK